MAVLEDMLKQMDHSPETRDVIKALGAIAESAGKHVGDGFQIMDVPTIIGETFAPLSVAADGITKVGEEVGKYQLQDATLVGQIVLEYVKAANEAYKAAKP